MTNPTHRLKQFVKYAGNEKPSSCYITDASGWLGSGVEDVNGKEIYEGDIVQVETFEKDAATVEFRNGAFWLGNLILADLPVIYYPTLEIVGHIAEETS